MCQAVEKVVLGCGKVVPGCGKLVHTLSTAQHSLAQHFHNLSTAPHTPTPKVDPRDHLAKMCVLGWGDPETSMCSDLIDSEELATN